MRAFKHLVTLAALFTSLIALAEVSPDAAWQEAGTAAAWSASTSHHDDVFNTELAQSSAAQMFDGFRPALHTDHGSAELTQAEAEDFAVLFSSLRDVIDHATSEVAAAERQAEDAALTHRELVRITDRAIDEIDFAQRVALAQIDEMEGVSPEVSRMWAADIKSESYDAIGKLGQRLW